MLLHQAIDEAKKRAVGQHVDYETFKNMVLVAHLKPLSAQVAPRIGEGSIELELSVAVLKAVCLEQMLQHIRLPKIHIP